MRFRLCGDWAWVVLTVASVLGLGYLSIDWGCELSVAPALRVIHEAPRQECFAAVFTVRNRSDRVIKIVGAEEH